MSEYEDLEAAVEEAAVEEVAVEEVAVEEVAVEDRPEVYCARHYAEEGSFVAASPVRMTRPGGTEYRADLCAECAALLTPDVPIVEESVPEPIEESVPEIEE